MVRENKFWKSIVIGNLINFINFIMVGFLSKSYLLKKSIINEIL